MTLRTLINSPICKSSPATLRASVGLFGTKQVFVGSTLMITVMYSRQAVGLKAQDTSASTGSVESFISKMPQRRIAETSCREAHLNRVVM